MGQVHVEHEAMAAQATALQNARADLDAMLTTIQAQIQDLVSGGFVTESASGSFEAAHERWNTAAMTCVAELETMGSYLARASEAFSDVDTQFTVR